MDALRQIRFLIPPFFVLGAIVAAVFADPHAYSLVAQFLEGDVNSQVTIVVAIIAAGVLPVGFLINSVTLLLADIILRPQKKILQAILIDGEFDDIHTLLVRAPHKGSEIQREWSASDKLNLIVNLDHGFVRKTFPGVADWSARTYSAFIVSLNSVVALVIAAIVVCVTDLNPHWNWCIVMLLLSVILVLGAWMARRDCNELTRFVIKNFGAMKTEIEKKDADDSKSGSQGS